MQKTPIERAPNLIHPIPTLTELPRLFPTIRQVQLRTPKHAGPTPFQPVTCATRNADRNTHHALTSATITIEPKKQSRSDYFRVPIVGSLGFAFHHCSFQIHAFGSAEFGSTSKYPRRFKYVCKGTSWMRFLEARNWPAQVT